MIAINYKIAKDVDKSDLSTFFSHYKSKDFIKNRVDNYTNYNFTIIARDSSNKIIPNKIVGVIQWSPKEDPNLGIVEFEELFVDKDYRGQGIGSSLLGFAVNSAIDYFAKSNFKLRKIYLFVGENNAAGIKLYEKHGFKKSANVGKLFSDINNEFLYILTI